MTSSVSVNMTACRMRVDPHSGWRVVQSGNGNNSRVEADARHRVRDADGAPRSTRSRGHSRRAVPTRGDGVEGRRDQCIGHRHRPLTRGRGTWARMAREFATIREATATRSHPRVLLVVNRPPMSLQGLYVAGASGFLNEVSEYAGGANAYNDVKRSSTQTSIESVIQHQPEVILEIWPDRPDVSRLNRERDVWNGLSAIPAVRLGGRVKTGHLWTPQNRPFFGGRSRPVSSTSFLPPGANRSAASCASARCAFR